MKWPNRLYKPDEPLDTWIELYLAWTAAMVTIVALAVVITLLTS